MRKFELFFSMTKYNLSELEEKIDPAMIFLFIPSIISDLVLLLPATLIYFIMKFRKKENEVKKE